MHGIVSDPQLFLFGLLVGVLIGVVIERYMLLPLAQLHLIDRRVRMRVRRRGG